MRIHLAFRNILLLSTSAWLVACASAPPPAVDVPVGATPIFFEPTARNRADADKYPYVVLLMIDGYRHDYNTVFAPPELTKIAQEGASAQALKPVFPSKTFPNHYSIATGLSAGRHGIVSNEFYDPTRDETYALGERTKVEDGTWYGGDPLWIAVQKQGLLSASVFFVGSEANVQGRHPNFYYRYDKTLSYDKRVDQVLDWLRLPADRRPHFVTLYLEGVDSVAHKTGVQSPQTREAVLEVDTAVARLRKGIAETGLPVNLVVVSDHGMLDVDSSKVTLIDENPAVAELIGEFRVVGKGPGMALYLNKGEDPKLIREMQKRLSALNKVDRGAKGFKVYRRAELPWRDLAANPRTGDLLIVPEAPSLVGLKASPPSTVGANHGWDPATEKAMHGILFAIGPAFKEKARVKTVDAVHVYPLVLDVLGLKPPSAIDGQVGALRPLTKKRNWSP